MKFHPGSKWLPTTLLTLCGSLLMASLTQSAEAPPEPVPHQLMVGTLSGVKGKEVNVLTVEYLPGGGSLPHRHNADVFLYVLEGALIMQLDGKEPVTVRQGQMFREGPADVHRRSANASETEPARFIIFMVKDQGKPATVPVGP